MEPEAIRTALHRDDIYNGVIAYLTRTNAEGQDVIRIAPGNDLELSYYISVMTRQGAFVRDGPKMAGRRVVDWSYPEDMRGEMFDRLGNVVAN